MNGIAVQFGDTRAINRFWEKISLRPGPIPKRGKCWEWTGACYPYGTFCDDQGKAWPAHRYSWTALVCPIPAGLVIDHLCQVQWCVNPSHLQPVTNAENVRRSNGWFHTPDGYCVRGHRLQDGATQCKACQRLRDGNDGSRITVAISDADISSLIRAAAKVRQASDDPDVVRYVITAAMNAAYWDLGMVQ